MTLGYCISIKEHSVILNKYILFLKSQHIQGVDTAISRALSNLHRCFQNDSII